MRKFGYTITIFEEPLKFFQRTVGVFSKSNRFFRRATKVFFKEPPELVLIQTNRFDMIKQEVTNEQ